MNEIDSLAQIIQQEGTRRFTIPTNDRDGWFVLMKSWKELIGYHEGKTNYVFEVMIHCGQNSSDSRVALEVQNLTYFFVWTDQFLQWKLKHGEQPIFHLVILLDGNNLAVREIFGRIQAFLSLQVELRSHNKFYVLMQDYETPYTYRFPSIESAGPSDKHYNYRGWAVALLRFQNKTSKQSTIIPVDKLPPLLSVAFQKRVSEYATGNSDDSSHQEGPHLTYEELLLGGGLNREQFVQCIDICKRHLGSLTALKAAFNEVQTSLALRKFPMLCANYLLRTLCGLSGTTEKQIKKVEDKQALCDKLKALLLNLFFEDDPGASGLSQLLLFIILHNLQKQKLLLRFGKGEDAIAGYSYNVLAIRNALIDSTEYADGLLQLLENSCAHTQSGIGYLSIRVHYIDRNCPESELVKVAERRSALRALYSRPFYKQRTLTPFPKKFDFWESAKYYLEFFLADNAIKLEGDKGQWPIRGIARVYLDNNSSSFEDNAQLELHDIFNFDIRSNRMPHKPFEKLNQVVLHYGTRQFKKTVLRNNGCFMVRSPSITTKSTEMYSAIWEPSFSVTAKKKNVPITVELPDDPDSRSVIMRQDKHWQHLLLPELSGATEYRILLPCRNAVELGNTTRGKRDVPKQPLDLSAIKDKNAPVTPTDFISMRDALLKLQDDTSMKTVIQKLGIGSQPDNSDNPLVLKRAALTQEEKGAVIQKCADRLWSIFAAPNSEWRKKVDSLNRIIFCVDLSELEADMQTVEVAAKTVMYMIGKAQADSASQEGTKTSPSDLLRLMAIFFRKDDVGGTKQMSQFLMAFSSFYDENGTCEYMRNVQIAICARNNYRNKLASTDGTITTQDTGELPDFPEVSFLLAGEKLSSVWRTADIFAFNNDATNTMHLLPHLRYLSDNEDAASKTIAPIAPFPFDLYLKASPVNRVCCDNWFLQQINAMIRNDIRLSALGCKIHNVHVRLGSNMHIEDFYEAEMLFQNARVVMRFAYMIVEQILDKRSDHNCPLVIVGYEPYSTILLEYIKDFLKTCQENGSQGTNSQKHSFVSYGIYGHDEDGKIGFQPSAQLKLHQKDVLATKTKQTADLDYVTIYPIGTTLSTVYRMRNAIADYFQGKTLQNCFNICVLLIGELGADKPNSRALSKLYWEKTSNMGEMTQVNQYEEKTVTLTSDHDQGGKDPADKVIVHYLLEATTQWHEQKDCSDPKNRQDNVLVYVDPTSTIPSSIFPLEKRKPDSPISFLQNNDRGGNTGVWGLIDKNTERLDLLRGCVHYGHIRVGNNHFQYHIDLPRFLQNALEQPVKKGESANDLENTLAEWAKEIDPQAYNIIATPLEQENAAFLRLIVDKVFAHSIRIIRIPFGSVRKEDVRAKYSYISEEYRDIKETNPDIKIHVYFVTMSFVTGESFHRAQKLVSMLLNDSGHYTYDGFLYKGVFTILNRSSKSTVNTMVKNPATDFRSYLHLAIPHYNTSQGKCPACNQHEKNIYLRDHCATNKARYSLLDTVQFSKLRTTDEYLQWRTKRIWTSRSEFEILALWLTMVDGQRIWPGISQQDWKMVETLRENCKKYVEHEHSILKESTEQKSPESIYARSSICYLTDKVSTETVESLWINGAVQSVAFRRLWCTHDAYCKLEDEKTILSQPYDKVEEATIKILTQMLQFPEKLMQENASGLEIMEHLENMISYIKVISREYLSKHHYIRSAMFQIMSVMLRLILGEQTGKLTSEYPLAQADRIYKTIIAPSKKAIPHQRYRLMMTLVNQLSTMQANIILHDDNHWLLKGLLRQVVALREEAAATDDWIGIPSDETVEDAYIHCIKKGMFAEE